MNLLTDTWIPVIRKDGRSDEISPLQLLEDSAENPVAAVHSVRPDFDGALLQFLIGVYQVLLSPSDEDEWRDLLDEIPSRASLSDRINLIAPAFVFDEGEFRFMQDGSVMNCDSVLPIQNIFIETDSFHLNVKPATVEHICPKCAAAALLTLELNSPSGGRGHMTSLRGGGPLTTLVVQPADEQTLWKTIVLNILPEDQFSDCDIAPPAQENLAKIFPWTAPVPNSENKEVVVPKDMHPYHVFWNLPRRIYVDFAHSGKGVCDLCGGESDALISGYWAKAYGMNYMSWSHPLTPYYMKKSKTEELLLPVRGREEGLSYPNWVGLVLSSSDGMKLPAKIIQRRCGWSSPLYGDPKYDGLKVYAFGYAMDNAKARVWTDGVLPTFLVSDDVRTRFMSNAEQLVSTASFIVDKLMLAVKQGITLDGDFASVKSSFWNMTEVPFYAALSSLPKAISADCSAGDEVSSAVEEIKNRWLSEVRTITLGLFKECVQVPLMGEADPMKAVKAELQLLSSLSKTNAKLCSSLGLPVPVTKRKSKEKT